MGKSIRSKQKRKHRTEFRNTIGTVAYNKQQAQVQQKLRTCIEKQSTSMEGLARLSKQLGNSDLPEPQNLDATDAVVEDGGGVADALETTTAPVQVAEKDYKGVNKAPFRKTRRGKKYSASMLKAKGAQTRQQPKEKPKPKFFCQF